MWYRAPARMGKRRDAIASKGDPAQGNDQRLQTVMAPTLLDVALRLRHRHYACARPGLGLAQTLPCGAIARRFRRAGFGVQQALDPWPPRSLTRRRLRGRVFRVWHLAIP
jgi:hypothetical protein